MKMEAGSIWRVLILAVSAVPAWQMGVPQAFAETRQSPDSTDSIRYWKPYVVDGDKDPRVVRAHAVFDRLLRAWDSTRVEPVLYVVATHDGPWAASLDDGSVLLSDQALSVPAMLDPDHGEDRLAFVLGHELAHQRDGHLWHRQFFRIASGQSPEQRRKLLAGLPQGSQDWTALGDKEAQADHDGLILMSVVGFNPFAIVGQGDFFKSWVENIWGAPCHDIAVSRDERKACGQAETRALRANAQLRDLAIKTTLFDLGVQAYIVGRYQDARRDFIAFGRTYSGRVVHTNIGLTYFAEAQQAIRQLAAYGEDTGPAFVYPLILGSPPQVPAERQLGQGGRSTRGLQSGAPSAAEARHRLHTRIDSLLDGAVHAFEQAVRIAPDNRQGYVHLASAYLLAGNAPMARGILDGQYRRRFGEDAELMLLSAMTDTIDGQTGRAIDRLTAMQSSAYSHGSPTHVDPLIRYTLHYNLAVLKQRQGDPKGARSIWATLAQNTKRDHDPTLFRLAVAQLQQGQRAAASDTVRLHAHSLGDRVDPKDISPLGDVWLEGERLRLYRFPDGTTFALDVQDRLVAAWQQGGDAHLQEDIQVGTDVDRVFHRYGIPDRRVMTERGEYFAYDGQGLAVRIEDQRVSGWFIYRSPVESIDAR